MLRKMIYESHSHAKLSFCSISPQVQRCSVLSATEPLGSSGTARFRWCISSPQCAKFIQSLMKPLISTCLTLNEMVTLWLWRSLTCSWRVQAWDRLRHPETTLVDKREVCIYVWAPTGGLGNPLWYLCSNNILHQELFIKSWVSACSQQTKIAHSDVIEMIVNIKRLK